jgi:hypothetical protein
MANTPHVKMFIASAGEMDTEREKCVLIINKINRSHKHLRLEVIEWEIDMPSGNVPGYNNIQEAINPKLLASDIVIFIFYSRLGKYTAQEFDVASKAGKKIFMYFKTGFIAESEDQKTIFKQLSALRSSLSDTVIWKEYASATEFELALSDDLHLYLAETYPPRLQLDNSLSNEFDQIRANLASMPKIYLWIIRILALIIIISTGFVIVKPEYLTIGISISSICLIILLMQVFSQRNSKNKIVNHEMYVKLYGVAPPPPKEEVFEKIIQNAKISIF